MFWKFITVTYGVGLGWFLHGWVSRKKGYAYESLQKLWRKKIWRPKTKISLWNRHEFFICFNEANESPNYVKVVKFTKCPGC